jgi:hexosaminidase
MQAKIFRKISILILAINIATAQAQKPSVHIIPEPSSLTVKAGNYTLPKTIKIKIADPSSQTAILLKEKLSKATGYKTDVTTTGTAATIVFVINNSPNTNLGTEGYTLTVSKTGVTATANTATGLYYAAQSMLQLLPSQIESPNQQQNISWSMPIVEITDSPRFGWRGLMLDVSRHFFAVNDVKKYIDQMARYKYNLLHWHLADDEGWRVEIKTLPKLTQIGAYSAARVGYFGTFPAPNANEPRTYGGYYTHEQIRDIVAYAKARHINIMPEIDVPGHSLAAIASYPELSLTPGADTYKVRSGEQIIDWTGPHLRALVDNNLNPANEKTYPFLDKVFTELAQLFPFEYVHIGGDECAKNFWEKDQAIQALMAKENLKTMEEVQSYFTKRIVKMVSEKGKKAIGWDEILEGGLAPGAAVMSWRGEKGGIEAAHQGHEVVMTPTQYCYIDYMQGDSAIEARVYSSLRLKKVYSFDPLPAGVDAKYIKGGQGNLWTEQIYNLRYAEYMTWPRSLALAECLWSSPERKNWLNFTQKTEQHLTRFDAAQVNYSPALYDPEITVTKDTNSQPVITLSKEIPDLKLHYSWDNTPPDQYYPIYNQPLSIPKDAHQLKVISYRGNTKTGRMLSITTAELRKRMR